MAVTELRRDPIEPSAGVWRFLVAGDPTTGTGFSAGIGSIITRADPDGLGYTYSKTGTRDSDWTQLSPAIPNLIATLPDIKLRHADDVAFKLKLALQ